MNTWIDGFQKSLDYIEEHLTETLDIEEIASEAALSPFYYQRIFGALCGMTVGEYIRSRRMTTAAEELAAGNLKVIDAAVKYGYDSPDSFARAFQRFHGIPPSKAREPRAALKSLAPLHIRISLEGGRMLDYRISKEASFTVKGIRRRIHSDASYQEIPEFWNEWESDPKGLKGMFGVCIDSGGEELDYWIADIAEPGKEVSPDLETLEIPEGLWAQFICCGPLPESLQSVNTEIWSEWLPNLKEYTLAGSYSLEVYGLPSDQPGETVSSIWIPLKKQ